MSTVQILHDVLRQNKLHNSKQKRAYSNCFISVLTKQYKTNEVHDDRIIKVKY